MTEKPGNGYIFIFWVLLRLGLFPACSPAGAGIAAYRSTTVPRELKRRLASGQNIDTAIWPS